MTFLKAPLFFALALTLWAAPGFAETTRNLAQEEANRQLVLKFYNMAFNEHKPVEAAELLSDDYKQHNPRVATGKQPFLDYFVPYFKENTQSRARIVRSAAQDDLVWLHLHSTKTPDDAGRAIVDIFRVRDGKIVEHWDVIQNVPETAANDNGMF